MELVLEHLHSKQKKIRGRVYDTDQRQITGRWYNQTPIGGYDAANLVQDQLAYLGHVCQNIICYKEDGRACIDDCQTNGQFTAELI